MHVSGDTLDPPTAARKVNFAIQLLREAAELLDVASIHSIDVHGEAHALHAPYFGRGRTLALSNHHLRWRFCRVLKREG